jgi:hypothetical protein
MNLRYSLCRRSFLIVFSVYVFMLATIVHVEVPLRWDATGHEQAQTQP